MLDRNVLAKTTHRLRARVVKAVTAVFHAGSLNEATECLANFKAGLGT